MWMTHRSAKTAFAQVVCLPNLTSGVRDLGRDCDEGAHTPGEAEPGLGAGRLFGNGGRRRLD